MRDECGIENGLRLSHDGGSLAVMNRCRGEQGDPAMIMFAGVPAEEPGAGGSGVFNTAESKRKLRPILECLELRFRVRIVI